MDLRARLQLLADALPPSGAVTFTRADLLELLAQEGGEPTHTRAVDLTVEEVAEKLNRSPSTVRNWLSEERLPGAYRLRGREWRIPPAALQGFLQQEAEGETPGPALRGPRKAGELSDWRSHTRAG